MNRLRQGLVCLIALSMLAGAPGCARLGRSTVTTELYQIPQGVETRWASAENWQGEKGQGGQKRGGRKGSPAFPLKAGEQKTLAEVKGASGTVRRIWITIIDRSPEMLRGIKLEMFWDGAAQPAVAVPLGDFFCQGLGRMTTFQNALFSNPEGRSFNCVVPMPFRKGMKIVVTNESGKDLSHFFYDVNYTLGDRHGKDTLYFHSIWRRENPTRMQKDFEILPRVNGRGRYLGTILSVVPDAGLFYRIWWGEGEVKAYIDGDERWPTLCGTGTEDYIGTGWGQGQYANLYQGCPVADVEKFQYAFYRLHVPDPVWFNRDCRVTIQQIGHTSVKGAHQLTQSGNTYYTQTPQGMTALKPEEIGTPDRTYLEREDDVACCTYFYLDRPENGLPRLAPVAQRLARSFRTTAKAGAKK